MAVVIPCRWAAAQGQSVLTYHGDASRSGNFVVPALTWDKASALRLDRSFDARVSGHLYAQPLYWRAPGSNVAMLVVATQDDVVEAFDARTGKQLWRRSVGPAGFGLFAALRQYQPARHHRHPCHRPGGPSRLFRRRGRTDKWTAP
jgi:hypothetical protein